MKQVGVLGAPTVRLLVVRAVHDAPVHQLLVRHEQAARGVVEVAPAEPVVRLVRHAAVVVAQAEVQGEPGVHLPVVLDVGGEVREVHLARVADLAGDAEARGLEGGGARVVAEEEVRHRVSGDVEAGPEVEVPRQVGGEVALQPPPAVVGAEVESVAALDPGGRVADVPHGLGARGVGVDRAPGVSRLR